MAQRAKQRKQHQCPQCGVRYKPIFFWLQTATWGLLWNRVWLGWRRMPWGLDKVDEIYERPVGAAWTCDCGTALHTVIIPQPALLSSQKVGVMYPNMFGLFAGGLVAGVLSGHGLGWLIALCGAAELNRLLMSDITVVLHGNSANTSGETCTR